MGFRLHCKCIICTRESEFAASTSQSKAQLVIQRFCYHLNLMSVLNKNEINKIHITKKSERVLPILIKYTFVCFVTKNNNQIEWKVKPKKIIGKLSISDDLMPSNSHLKPNSYIGQRFRNGNTSIDLSIGYAWCFSHFQQITKQNAPQDYRAVILLEFGEEKK